ncbi:hypothetical protein GJAV_G00176360 [Gymnothorax javanicus]|nr:hypothetical protein GJAV_G00176360 [Gymnothorax javanicus]
MDSRDCECELKKKDESPCPSLGLPELAAHEASLPVTRGESLSFAGVEETPCKAQEMETELNAEQSFQGDPEVDDAGGPNLNPASGASLPQSEPDSNFDLEEVVQGDSVFPCSHCERYFTTKQGLERHIHIHVSDNLHMHTFKCRYCGKIFGSQTGRRRHERRHESGPNKRQGCLAGALHTLSPSSHTDSLSSNPISAAGSILTMDSVSSSITPEHSGKSKKVEDVTAVEQALLLDENGESRELHPCKYCKKAFSSHTNMRRHQRRIHERHLLPKGILDKASFLQEVKPVSQRSAAAPHGSHGARPQLAYLASHEAEDEGDREEEYMVDISSNISENLSLYIDGKILSTDAVSGCDVFEVDAGSAKLMALDTVIISQAVKLETVTCVRREAPSTTPQTLKRRTSTPPLLPVIKTEPESSSSHSASSSSSVCSTSSSSSSSSSSLSMVGAPAIDGTAFPKEKTAYLSPKLKQLLQKQEGHRVTTPAPCLLTSSRSGRYKRRTASPPNSPPQEEPKSKGLTSDAGSPLGLKVPMLESHCRSPVGSREEGDSESSPRASWLGTLTGGSPCNQQPLDLSSAPGKNGVGVVEGEAVLDLSMHCRSSDEVLLFAGPSPQPPSKKRKPNTSILEKVLMKEYSGVDLAERVPDDQGSKVSQLVDNANSEPSSDMSSAVPEVQGDKLSEASTSEHPFPPSLMHVSLNAPAPCTTSLRSTTPPPLVLLSVSYPLCSPCQSSEHESVTASTQKISSVILVSQEECSPPRETNSLCAHSEKLLHESNLCADLTVDIEDQEHPSQPLSMRNPKISTTCVESDSVCVPHINSSGRPDYSRMSPRSGHGCEDIDEPGIVQSPLGSVVACEADPNLDTIQEQKADVLQPLFAGHPVLEASLPEPASHCDPTATSETLLQQVLPSPLAVIKEESDHKDDSAYSACTAQEPAEPETFSKNFICNVCEEPFCSMKELRCHIMAHAQDWPFKCEFCVQLFQDGNALLEHRSSLHGVGRIYVCCTCNKEFAFFCNLQQHQSDLHPAQSCTHIVLENGKLRPQNFTDPTRASTEPLLSNTDSKTSGDSDNKGAFVIQKEEPENNNEMDDPTEELYTTIKIMASEGGKRKGLDVRLGINQHYPSFKPPPFPYHNRTPVSSVESATNFTAHNIPQTFSTAIRCTKCGKSFDNMPELHKHILSCANASDKRRYTPKKNPIPLRQAVKPLYVALSPSATPNVLRITGSRMGQPRRLNFDQEPTGKAKSSRLSKKKNWMVQRTLLTRNTSRQLEEAQGMHVCPHCQREFAYPGSLNKHITVSCPKKPAFSGSSMHRADESIAQGRSRYLRSAKRASDTEMQKEESDLGIRTLGKSGAGSSGLLEGTAGVPVKPLLTRGKATASQAQQKVLTISPSSSTSISPLGKKGKGPPGQQKLLPLSPSAQRPAGRMQRGWTGQSLVACSRPVQCLLMSLRYPLSRIPKTQEILLKLEKFQSNGPMMKLWDGLLALPPKMAGSVTPRRRGIRRCLSDRCNG